MRDNVAADERCGYTGIVNGIQDAMRAEIERCMVNWGAAGKADAVLAAAEAWQPCIMSLFITSKLMMLIKSAT